MVGSYLHTARTLLSILFKRYFCQDVNGGFAFCDYFNGTFPCHTWKKGSVEGFGEL